MYFPVRRLNWLEIVKLPLHWEIDPQHVGWYQACYGGEVYFLRFNFGFPGVPLFSLLIDKEETVELEDLPDSWVRTRSGDRDGRPFREWPTTAQRREEDDDFDDGIW